jgi:hypothetical protein
MKKISQKSNHTFSVKSLDKKSSKARAAATMHNSFAIEGIMFAEETFENLEKKINPKKSSQK